ncbi:MAG TPA: hypothetical protein VNL71_07280 [Chloroflexota bacterium]|nr:hypothetical protein [Chloroflexota bacterium]
MERREPTRDPSGFGISMPVFLGIWLVCAVVAGLDWQNLVAGTSISSKLTITFPAMIVLSLSFGLAGAALVAAAVGIFRRP